MNMNFLLGARGRDGGQRKAKFLFVCVSTNSYTFLNCILLQLKINLPNLFLGNVRSPFVFNAMQSAGVLNLLLNVRTLPTKSIVSYRLLQ